MAHSTPTTLDPASPDLDLGRGSAGVVGFGFALGVAGLTAAALLGNGIGDNLKSFYHAYLATYTFLLSIALGGLFFVIIHHLTRAGWSVVVRRISEAVSTAVLAMAILFIPIVSGMHELYHWTHPEVVAADPILAGKAVWLNQPFFLLRVAIYFLIWIGLSQYFHRLSVQQDATGDVELSHRMQRMSALAIILFALSTTFAGFDLLMSLDPHWFSTIYGVYFFAGGAMAFFATLYLVIVLAGMAGKLTTAINAEHRHDVGKLLFAFTCFWAYIAFSQYMLIWYANMPEETGWFQYRHRGEWGVAGVAFLVFGHFIAPFVLIMSRNVKRMRGPMTLACLWILGVCWFDHYWLVMPIYSPESIPFGMMEVALVIGMGGFFIAWVAKQLRARAPVPLRDPRLPESLAFENY
jgi:hypothetical protein